MKAKHTPGNWSHQDGKIRAEYNIAHINGCRTTEGEANAKLIAAAPELLEALQNCLNYFEDREDADHNGEGYVLNDEMQNAEMIRAAIRKATS